MTKSARGTGPRIGPTLSAALAVALLAPILSGLEVNRRESPSGPYPVGYRAEAVIDESRPGFSPEAPGRPVRVQIWYPALRGEGVPVVLGDYVRDEARLVDSRAAESEDLRRAIREYSASNPIEGGSPDDVAAILMARSTAFARPRPANGKFPLILYFHTSAIAKSIPCELLASHGFVVVSTSVAGSFEPDLDVALSGAETQARDLEYAAAWAARVAPADLRNVGLAGMSFGGISEFLFASRHPEVKAIVSLDGGAGSDSGAATIRESPFFDVSRIRTPILHEYQPEGADLGFLEGLRYADRTLARFASLRHIDFSGSGVLRDAATRGTDERSRERAEAFGLMTSFFRAHLLRVAEGGRPLDASGTAGGPSFRVTRIPALPPPPLFEELRAMIRAKGIAGMAADFEGRRSRDPRPYSEDTFRKLGSWLMSDGRNEDARSLFSLQVDMDPGSSRAHYFLALAARNLGDRDSAREHFQRALALAPADRGLSVPARERIEKAAKEGLGPP